MAGQNKNTEISKQSYEKQHVVNAQCMKSSPETTEDNVCELQRMVGQLVKDQGPKADLEPEAQRQETIQFTFGLAGLPP